MKLPRAFMQLAKTQDGVVTRRQALATGLSPDAIKHATSPDGRWQRIHRGVYATFRGPLQTRHLIRAALLLVGPSAVVSGPAACKAYGMTYVTGDQVVVLVPHNTRPPAMSQIEFRRTRTLPDPRQLGGFPCAPPERAVIDALRGVRRLRDVRAALSECVQRGLAAPEQLRDVAAQLRCGDTNVWATLAEVAAGCRSNPECECLELIRTSSVLPEPVLNQPLPDLPDLIPDGRWDEARLIYEIDSAEWHRFGDRPEATERRRARLAAAGLRVIPISPRRLREEPMAVLRELEAAYIAGLGAVVGFG